MPSDYQCSGCGLQFSMGWYHYQNFDSGFGSATLLVCTECCAQHQIEHAIDLHAFPISLMFYDVTLDEVPVSARIDVMARVRAQLGLSLVETKRVMETTPIYIGRDLPEYVAINLKATFASLGADVGLTPIRTEALRSDILQQQDRLLFSKTPKHDRKPGTDWKSVAIYGERSGVTSQFKLDEQACACCRAVGTLTAEIAQVPTNCANCRSVIKEMGGWVT